MTKPPILVATIILVVLIGAYFYLSGVKRSSIPTSNPSVVTNRQKIKYIPIGDSYTIGLGVKEQDRWPNMMVAHLKEQGIDIELVKNPAVSGYTVSDAIQYELPVVQVERADFVTVFVGANDNFRQGNAKDYQQELSTLLDQVQKTITDSKRVLVITIPDYTASSVASSYGSTKTYQDLIKEYNKVIKIEADKRGLKVADIFPISQTMTTQDFYISDGLHPSKKGYEAWEKVIYRVALEMLKGDTSK